MSKLKTAQFLLTTQLYNIQTEIQNIGISKNRHECNVCGWKGKQFYAFWNEMCREKDQTLCPKCKSCVYQRNLVKYLQENCDPNKYYDVMECSPHSSDPVGAVLKNMNYVSIDIVNGRAMFQMDLTDMQFYTESFDLVICSAVLEHVKDDVKALKEIYRVLRRGGRAIIEIPIGYYKDMLGHHTVEFKGMPFYEHRRSYGTDFIDKMNGAGFKTSLIKCRDDKLGLESPSLMGFYVGVK
jgi:SAM-dependent methyltransferase